MIPIVVNDVLKAAMGESAIDAAIEQSAANSNDSNCRYQVALDIVGSGGGQWLLTLADHRILKLEAGLPPETSSIPVLRMSAKDLVEVVRRQGNHHANYSSAERSATSHPASFEKLYHGLALGIADFMATESR